VPLNRDGAGRDGAGRDRSGRDQADRAELTARRRAEIRAFARANHPDVGGDPDVFAAGLRRLRLGQSPVGERDRWADRERPVEVTIHRRVTGPGLVIAWIRRRCWDGNKPPRVT
jgi:hypothetical protein